MKYFLAHVDHIEHITLVAGVDRVGIGNGFDGIGNLSGIVMIHIANRAGLLHHLSIDRVPKGLEDVSKYPNLFAELIRREFSDDDVKKISRLNLIRVLEKTSSEMQGQFPDNTLISLQPNGTCRPGF